MVGKSCLVNSLSDLKYCVSSVYFNVLLYFQFLEQNWFEDVWIKPQRKSTFPALCTEHSTNNVGKC